MTGYGKADVRLAGKKIHVEIKSLNSKSLDLSTRIAPLFRDREMEIRQYIAAQLERGKVDFNLWVERDAAAPSSPINADAVATYKAQLESISAAQGITLEGKDLWSILVRLPDTTLVPSVEEVTEEEWNAVREGVKQAVAALVEFRQQEGRALFDKFTEKVDNIERLMHEIEPFEKERVERIRRRLEERLAELKGVDYDRNRLEQELIYYIEKLDISEEKQRLANHLNYFRETMRQGKGQGKKLGFIAQEMGREINTTGSKSNQAEMQNIVVRMKDELEQIKEQVLNVM